MRTTKTCTLLLVLVCSVLGQDASKSQIQFNYLIQSTEISQTNFGDIEQFCVEVRPDGHFHMEKGGMGSYGEMKPKIYEGQLSDAEMDALKKILTAEDFMAIKVHPKPTMAVTHSNGSLVVNVHEGTRSQSFFISSDAQEKEFKNALAPFRTWLIGMKKRKVPVMKNAESNACSGGMLMPQ